MFNAEAAWCCDDDEQEEEQVAEQQAAPAPGDAPRFKRGLTALSVELSRPLRLDCQVDAASTPNVAWYRNGIELDAPRYMYASVSRQRWLAAWRSG